MTTGRCERALVTLLGSARPWRERLYLVGGLAPKRSACLIVFLGLESVSQETLDACDKHQTVEDISEGIRKLHEHGIRSHGMFVQGPTPTRCAPSTTPSTSPSPTAATRS